MDAREVQAWVNTGYAATLAITVEDRMVALRFSPANQRDITAKLIRELTDRLAVLDTYADANHAEMNA